MAADGPTQPSPVPVERRIGRFIIKRELGRGGMGAVYLGEDPETGEKVAVKELLITAAADPVAVKRFLQEGELMSRIAHPNVVGVRDIIDGGQGHYIALEFIEGGSLRDLLGGRPLPTPQAFAVMHGLLQALDYAHQHQIVHRDVKPENVMLSNAGEVKVADFGIARLNDDSATSNATKTGTTVGTPQYMSPEQVTTSKVDGRSDLYSAGIVCYEVFCGRPPFEATAADGPFTLFAKHVQAPPPPPTVIRPGLDPALETVILKSLAKRPEDRYQTGLEFDRELSQIGTRLCGPDWPHSLEPGADLSLMVPPLAPTMVGIPVAAAGAMPAAPPLAGAPPVYAPQPPAPKAAARPVAATGPNWSLIGGAAAALLVVAGIVAFLAFGRPASRAPVTPAPTSSTTAAPTAGPCDFLKAPIAPAAGTGGTCGLKLGSALQADVFSGQSALPADLTGVAIDSNAAASGKPATVPVSGGFAALTSPSSAHGSGVFTANPGPADEVVIADFTPTTAGDANVGVAIRCGAACVAVYVSPKGKVWIGQRTAAGPFATKFNDSAQVQVNQINRLVVAIRGTQVQAWLNGNLISSVPVDVTGAGPAGFFVLDQDSTPAATNLTAFYTFAPG
ncbi:MAG: hypothetical protein NVS9B1_00840 [Candidatus Dormibacteraceae bacterium]